MEQIRKRKLEKVEKVAGNVKEIWKSNFVLKFNDIQLEKLKFFQKSNFFIWIITLQFFLPHLHPWNFSAVVARWPFNLTVPSSSPTETTIFSISCTKKGFLVFQLDVIKKQKWADEMNADNKSFLELSSSPMEHF